MKLSTALNGEQFADFVNSVDGKHLISVTATCGEFKKLVEACQKQADDDAPEVKNLHISAKGIVTRIVTEGYPFLLDILTPSNDRLTISVYEPLITVLENEIKVGDTVVVDCQLKPYNELYYSLKLLHLKLLTAEGKWLEWAP
mgnify:CR=1 FL=1